MITTTTRRTRLGLLATAAAALALVPAFLAAPAQADPPANDDIAHATVVTTDVGAYTTDTTEATADPTDGSRVGGHSVWFTFRADRSGRLAATTAGSSYDTKLTFFSGPRKARELVDWDRNTGPGYSASERLRIHEGVRYWIAVSSQGAQTGGGDALLTIGQVVGSGIELTDLAGEAGLVSGRLFVTGTLTCTTESTLYLYVRASQRVGDNVALGEWDGGFDCRPDQPIPLSMSFDSFTGWAFQPGQVVLGGSYEYWDGITWDYTSLPVTTAPVVEAPNARRAQ